MASRPTVDKYQGTGHNRLVHDDGGRAHVAALIRALVEFDPEIGAVERLGAELADRLAAGRRVLTVGNGGSAAHAQHLASELVARYSGDRSPLGALALTSDGVVLTATSNDFGASTVFARQVAAHGQAGDVLIAFSTSGTSQNVLAAVEAAGSRQMATWGVTGPRPNDLTALCDEAVAVPAEATATIQEVHQVVVHLLCASVDCALAAHV